MRFHVLGVGAIGSLLSHHLRRSLPSGHNVTLIHKTIRSARDAQEKGGIRVESGGLSEVSRGFKSEIFEGGVTPRQSRRTETEEQEKESEIEGSSNDNNDVHGNVIESLFVTAKAHQTVPAIRGLSQRLSADSTIVLMQNGMGVYEELLEEIFRNPLSRPHFILASNTHGAYARGPYDVVHAGMGEIRFGIVRDVTGRRNYEAGFFNESVSRAERLPKLSDITTSEADPFFTRYQSLRNTVAALLLMDTLKTSWTPMEDMQIAMRRKLVVNSVINPLTSIMGCKNGDILSTPTGLDIMRAVCHEASRVFAAEMRAASHSYLDSIGASEAARQEIPPDRMSRELSAESLQQECLRVAEATKHNISSTLADIRRGASQTEINYMNGYLVRLGKLYKVSVPTITTLWRLVYMRSAIPLDQGF
ncbi:2-dehydropantoate 2-reductase (Ketopantoate reductase) (KPA reductase) (KPR) [Paramarasmius palmivorus]|uniref:2-dehydropantoate 2-reductase n=1 Tax=Paramarasmius palmivorus TaxID=297713 RepID=A0AAW0E2M1_9AGAR